jgi:ribonuclease HI
MWNTATAPTNDDHSSDTAEIAAVEAAVTILPRGAKATIILDSEWLLNDLKSWGNKTQTDKRRSAHHLALERIHRKCLSKLGSQVRWIRIDSHIEEKLNDPNTSDEKKERIRTRLAELGEEADLFQWMNEKADRLAKEGAKLRTPTVLAYNQDEDRKYIAI